MARSCDTKVCCVKCNREISLINFNRHYDSCGVESKPKISKIYPDDLKCRFCGKECNGKSGFSNHERLCSSNPNREEHPRGMLGKKAKNQFIKAKESNTSVIIKDSTRKKLSESAKLQIWDDERRRKHSESMKLAVKNNPDSYTSSNRGRVKQIIFDGIKFQGNWELEFYQFCKNNNIQIERTNEWFEYEWNGIRKYFPDFYLTDIDLYVEVKGYETDRDRAKFLAFPKNLLVIRKEDIGAIRNRTFDLFDKINKLYNHE